MTQRVQTFTPAEKSLYRLHNMPHVYIIRSDSATFGRSIMIQCPVIFVPIVICHRYDPARNVAVHLRLKFTNLGIFLMVILILIDDVPLYYNTRSFLSHSCYLYETDNQKTLCREWFNLGSVNVQYMELIL